MSELAFAEVARATDSAPLVVAGKSQGRVSALYPSASHPVDGLSLRDPPPLRETVLGRHPRGPLRGLARALAAKLPEALDMVDNAAHSDSPAVMLLSQQDRIVPFGLQQRVRDAYRGTSR